MLRAAPGVELFEHAVGTVDMLVSEGVQSTPGVGVDEAVECSEDVEAVAGEPAPDMPKD